jgi:hypothetical protein
MHANSVPREKPFPIPTKSLLFGVIFARGTLGSTSKN